MLLDDYKVVKHNFLINAKSKYKYSLNELKLICHLIANILPTDTNLETKKVLSKGFIFQILPCLNCLVKSSIIIFPSIYLM